MSHTNTIIRALGFGYGAPPTGGLGERDVTLSNVGDVRVWVEPLLHRTAGPGVRLFKRSTHRVMCQCPKCGRVLSVGRLHQHFGTVACLRAAMKGPLKGKMYHARPGDL